MNKIIATSLLVLSVLFTNVNQAAESAESLKTVPGLTYAPDGQAIAIENGTLWSNRPLYCNQRVTLVNVGEQPAVSGPMGTLYLGYERDHVRLMLHLFEKRISRYYAGRMEWEFSDPRWPGLKLTLIGTTLADATGFTARLEAAGDKPGDRMAWCYFPADPDTQKHYFNIQAEQFQIDSEPKSDSSHVAGCVSSAAATWEQMQFANRQDLMKLESLPSNSNEALLGGRVAWVTWVSGKSQSIAVAQDEAGHGIGLKLACAADAEQAFAEGLARSQALQHRATADTPDPYFNAGVSASVAAVLGLYVAPTFVHGGSAWRDKIPGWRLMGGAYCYGWHDLVASHVAYWKGCLVQNNEGKAGFTASPDGTMQAGNTRWSGKGFLNYPGLLAYEFQTQFFDDAIRNWRATADSSYEKMLLPMLKLEVERIKECFDPDGDGLYESYNNTWPSDSVGFNGGGTPEASAYAYYANQAAAEMCLRAGEPNEAKAYQAEADKIKAAVQKVLWLKDKGQFASYLEQDAGQPSRRIHDDAWIYAQHVPIEAGMTTPEQAWQAMYYTDWAMEHYHFAYGGEMRQSSNWVPGQWSIRQLYHGDNFAMALGYFLAGQGDDGWNLLRGTMVESMYGDTNPKVGYSCEVGQIGVANIRTPGGLSCPNCAIDFNDITSMFARATVEGLFGYNPDYPNGIVEVTPAFPSAWDHASLKVPDFELNYHQSATQDIWRVKLAKPATLSFRLPVRAANVTGVTVNGKTVRGELKSWAGHGVLLVKVPTCDMAEITISVAGRRPEFEPIFQQKRAGELIDFSAFARNSRVIDPQECLTNIKLAEGRASAVCSGKAGNHLVFLEVSEKDTTVVPYLQLLKLDISDPKAEALRVAQVLKQAPANVSWKCIDMSKVFNGDIQSIFKQKYASPRPETCSMRTGYDGWRSWTFGFWGMQTPVIGLDRVLGASNDSLVKDDKIITSQNATFNKPAPDKNIAFTSLWDNWPRSVEVPVGSSGDSVWLLVCGQTQPVTQGRIVNAVLHFHYADGKEEKLELVPPFNFWSLCPWGKSDYDYKIDGFALPKEPPQTVQLGTNCRAMVYGWKLRPGVVLSSVTLETLSQEVIMGLMAVSVINPH